MHHLPSLVQDLAIILMTAAMVTLLFRKLKQPVVLGYLIAGLLIGPHVTVLPTVTDTEGIRIWAEIGMIFLLFGLGLEFSFKKLAQVGKSASITATVEVLGMLGLGYLGGSLLGWNTMDSLFLGGILSISSTTIILRAFDELGMKARSSAKLVFGVLIVEDLLAILLLVLLGSVSSSPDAAEGFSPTLLVGSFLRLGFFLTLCFVLGIYLLPMFLGKVRKLLSDETALIVACGFCLAMVMISEKVGFSPALGAFMMGSILAETREGKRFEHLLTPVKDLFAAVFFVSVGMMIDPSVLSRYGGTILIISLLTIVGKFGTTALGALVSGRSLKHSVEAGLSLAQIGEFSFIIATLGVTQKVTSEFLYPVAVAVSALTTFTTPYLIKSSGFVHGVLEARLPVGLRRQLSRYEVALSHSGGPGVLAVLGKEYGVKILLNSVVVIAIGLASAKWAYPFAGRFIANQDLLRVGMCVLTLFLCGPFLWAVILGRPAHRSAYAPGELVVMTRLQGSLVFLRIVLGTALAAFVCKQFTGLQAIVGAVFAIATIIALFFSRYTAPFYQMVENRFLANLSDRERADLSVTAPDPVLVPWNLTLTDFVVSPHSELAGQTLRQSALKEKLGLTVAMIERGHEKFVAPGPAAMLLPFDRVQVIGNEEQLDTMRALAEDSQLAPDQYTPERYGLDSLIVAEAGKFDGKKIRESGIRDAFKGLLVGIERGAQRILNPESDETLKAGDILWIVGDLKLIKEFKRSP